jgi:precorrin isomerase
MVRNTCEFVTGRLLEIRVAAGYRVVADVDEMIAMIGKRAATLAPGEKYTIVADWRAVHIMPPDTAARAEAMLSVMNPHVVRSAILTLPEEPTTNLQVVRLIREAENPNRRHFTSPKRLYAWLSGVLTPEESEQLEKFLAQP